MKYSIMSKYHNHGQVPELAQLIDHTQTVQIQYFRYKKQINYGFSPLIYLQKHLRKIFPSYQTAHQLLLLLCFKCFSDLIRKYNYLAILLQPDRNQNIANYIQRTLASQPRPFKKFQLLSFPYFLDNELSQLSLVSYGSYYFYL